MESLIPVENTWKGVHNIESFILVENTMFLPNFKTLLLLCVLSGRPKCKVFRVLGYRDFIVLVGTEMEGLGIPDRRHTQ
jgi:hypothetical protein